MTPKEQTPDAQPQNYICLNCKLVLNHEPKQCPECRHQFFHKTDAHECEHFLMTDVAVYACDCDNIQIVDVKDGYTTEYVPKDQPSTSKPESGERILCAAIWFPSRPTPVRGNCKNIGHGLVLCGWRHWNVIMQFNALFGKPIDADEVQGFLTSEGRFVGRAEGKVIADAVKQTIAEHSTVQLFSEDLY